MLIKIRQPIIVEGRYDRIRLASLIDGVIIETGGFRIFKDKALLDSLRHIARTTGLILLTDSDQAGFRIRNFLKNALGPKAKLTQVYIPGVKGVERRKQAPSAEGLLGVEGMDSETLRAAFERAGVGCETVVQKSNLTAADLFEAGLTGKHESATRRRALLRELHLPERLSNSAMLTMLNTLLTREEFFTLAESLPQ
ncbi:MAG: RNAse [Oscillospiraceae bacterium]|jgi:ribonuclease M5|nr:RNAse [Oscillospiraceae bacterium]